MLDTISIFTVVLGPVALYWLAVVVVSTPELFMRMSSTVKAAIIGVGALLVAMAIYFNDLSGTSGALAMISFVLAITPMAAYAASRTLKFVTVPLLGEKSSSEVHQHHGLHKHDMG